MNIGTVLIVILGLTSTNCGFYWPADRVPSLIGVSNVTSYLNSNVIRVSIVLPSDAYKIPRSLPAAQKRSGAGVLLGFQTAQDLGWLPEGVYFNITIRESGCNSTYGLKSFLDAYIENANVLFGPACDYSLGKQQRSVSGLGDAAWSGRWLRQFVQTLTSQTLARIWVACSHISIKPQLSLGYFHLARAIFTPLGKIYPLGVK